MFHSDSSYRSIILKEYYDVATRELLHHCSKVIWYWLALWYRNAREILTRAWSIRRSMSDVDEITATEDRLDHGLPVEFTTPPGLHRGYQSLVSVPGGHRRHFLFRPVLNLLVYVAAIVDRSFGSLTHSFCIRYHLRVAIEWFDINGILHDRWREKLLRSSFYY